MNSGIPFLDLILLAAVAGFIILQLRRVLGRRDGHDEPPSYDPYRAHQEQNEEDDKIVSFPDRNGQKQQRDSDFDDAPDMPRDFNDERDLEPAAEDLPEDDAFAESDVERGLRAVGRADRDFDGDAFVGGAAAAFEMIINAFAAGDRDTLRPLLADDVFENFAGAIDEREAAREVLETTLVGIVEKEIIEAELRQRTAFITVKFVSEQINVTKDADGEVVDGDASHVARITDLWTFARNTRSRDPNWTLVATRSPN